MTFMDLRYSPACAHIAAYHRRLLRMAEDAPHPRTAAKYRDQAMRQGAIVGLPISPTGPKIRQARP